MTMSRMLVAALLLVPQAGRAQSELHSHPSPAPVVAADAGKLFAALKALEGVWVGPVETVPAVPTPTIGDAMRITMRVTSRGNAITHEMHGANVPYDPTRYDHPVSMIYINEGQLMLTHYCDAGNRPRMVASVSEDGKTITFETVDVSGSLQYGNMQSARFIIIDKDRHVQEWSYRVPSGRIVIGRFEVRREQAGT